jgi:NADH-quinone oxidoreductase subunit M
MAYFAPLIAWAFWIGIYPKPYFDILEKPVAKIVERVKPVGQVGNLRPIVNRPVTGEAARNLAHNGTGR